MLEVSAVRIQGSGRLRAAVEERIAGLTPGRGTPVLAVCDGWEPAMLNAAADTAAEAAVSFLGVHIELGQAVIGPAVLPGEPGCLTCLANRRAAVDLTAAAEGEKLLEHHGKRLAEPSTWLTAFAVNTVAGIAAGEVAALLKDERPRTHRAVIVVELKQLRPEVHPFLPDPLCPVCAIPPGDDPARATIRLTSRPKPAPETLRVTDLASRADQVRQSYVDRLAGVVSEVRDTDAVGLPVSYAPTSWPGQSRPEIGIGRSVDRKSSAFAAVLEAVERRAGSTPSGKRTQWRASYAELAEHAVHPASLGLLPPDTADRLGYPRFEPDRVMEWVWGYSFGRAAPVLVPRTYAYYGHPIARRRETPLVYETSNGCALGGCLEEAIVYALLEVAERDAFLLTWYARMPARRVAVASARSPEIRLLAERIERTHGYRVLAFDTTVEYGIPSLALLAVDDSDDPNKPAVMCAAAAHLDPERACWAALGELALVVAHQVREYPDNRERAAAMVADPGLVREMEDHAILYGHRDTVPRWDFLLKQDGERSFAESFADRPAPGTDLRDDLLELVRRYGESDLDVIVVDQTGPEQAAQNLVVVKAIVPGTLPITFGHRNRRVHGLPRLHTVPMLLGHRATPMPDAEINPHPHPFP